GRTAGALVGASARPKREVRAALVGERPAVVIIPGVGSVVDDVGAQLREAKAGLALQVVRIARPAEVAGALRQAACAAAVAMTRAGGQGAHDLDDEGLIQAVADSLVLKAGKRVEGAPGWPPPWTGCPGRGVAAPVTLSGPGPARLRSRLLRHRCPRRSAAR